MGDCLSSPQQNNGSRDTIQMSTPVVIPATARHTATVIFLHGLGDTGHGWAAAFNTIRTAHVKYVCPTASTQPVTLNAGFQMPSWFDIKSLSVDAEQDEQGIINASKLLHGWIDEEVANGIDSQRIVVGGFSQGGALALYSAFTYPKPLGGILALSSWLPLHDKLTPDSISNKSIPILQCHGEVDPLVIPKVGQLTASFLRALNSNHTFKMYPNMAHSSSEEELADVKQFIESNLSPV